jgi:pimeloyl-ACP methyl ester carboxylesterase
MSTYVLVHGACHDGSTWDAVVDALEARGHTAFAPTVAGHGPLADRRVTHADCTLSITDFIAEKGLHDVILVGHSYGGSIISKVAEAIPEKLRRLIFFSAFVLKDGESMLDTFPVPLQEMLRLLAAESEDDTVTLPFEVWRQVFMNDGDDAQAREAYERLWPEPFGPLAETLDMRKFHSLSTPRSYIVGSEDGVPPGDDDWHSRMARRLGTHQFVEIAGGHEAVFTNPVGLADGIIEAGGDNGPRRFGSSCTPMDVDADPVDLARRRQH